MENNIQDLIAKVLRERDEDINNVAMEAMDAANEVIAELPGIETPVYAPVPECENDTQREILGNAVFQAIYGKMRDTLIVNHVSTPKTQKVIDERSKEIDKCVEEVFGMVCDAVSEQVGTTPAYEDVDGVSEDGQMDYIEAILAEVYRRLALKILED